MKKSSLALMLIATLGLGAPACSSSGGGGTDSAAGSGGSGGTGGATGGSGGSATGGSGGTGTGGSGGTGTGGSGGTGTGGSGGTGGKLDGGGGGKMDGGAKADGGAPRDGAADANPGGGADGAGGDSASPSPSPMMSFFVTSVPAGMGGNLGGLAMADKKCKDLATAVGAGAKDWVAFLSVEHGPTGAAINAKDRIGTGPWYDQRGRVVGMSLPDLLTGMNMRPRGDMAAVDDLLDEKGTIVPKQPLQHDILTGTLADGTVAAGQTCMDWTSDAGSIRTIVGHADTRGPDGTHNWINAHQTQSCSMAGVAAGGGNGRIYCLAVTH